MDVFHIIKLVDTNFLKILFLMIFYCHIGSTARLIILYTY